MHCACKVCNTLTVCYASLVSLSLSLHFNGHFPHELGLAGFIEAKDGGSGGDNWSYKACKAPVRSSPPTNQHPMFYRLDDLPVAKPTVSEHFAGLLLHNR